ncbi:hypothetical protein A9Q99_15310 [Gammaproteobacteria bacterium 45_16_T64]|nr:hypothetical protein A9Q99_15310 [Gammaproteobacteria bacterium 45_16_T64]
MNYLRPLAHLSRVFSHTGIPLCIVAGAITASIYYGETTLSNPSDNIQHISLSLNPSEEYDVNEIDISVFQMDTATTGDTSKNAYIGLILDGIKRDIFSNNPIDTLSMLGVPDDSLTETYVAYYYLLVRQKSYQTVIDQLSVKSVPQRLAEGTQFYYALSLSKKGHQQDALDQYNQLIKKNTNHQSATLNSAIIHQKMEDYTAAFDLFEKAVTITSGSRKAKALAGAARCSTQLGNINIAIQYYQKSIEYRPGNAVTWRLLADTMAINHQDYRSVVDTYDKAIALNPNYSIAIERKSRYQMENADFYGSIKTLSQALPKSFSESDRQQLLTWNYIALGQRSNALRSITKLVDIEGDNPKTITPYLLSYVKKSYKQLSTKKWNTLPPSILYLHALSDIKRHKYDAATKKLAVIKDHPTLSTRVALTTAKVHRLTKQYRESLAIYNRILRSHPQATNAWYDSSKVYSRLKDHQQALSQLEPALAYPKAIKKYQLAQADYLMALKQHARAIEVLESAHDTFPRSIKTLSRLIAALIVIDDNTSAEFYLLTMAKRTPRNLDNLMQLANIQYQQAHYESSIATLNNILEIKPNHIEGRFLLANVSLKQGDKNGTLSQLSQLLKLDNAYQPAIKLRNKLLLKRSASRASFSQLITFSKEA